MLSSSLKEKKTYDLNTSMFCSSEYVEVNDDEDNNDDNDGDFDCFSDDVEPSADVQRVIPSGGFSKVERKTSNDIFAGSQKLV